MRRLLFCLLATMALAGCFGPNATFSCMPDVGYQRIDADQFRRPATTAGTGYLHC